MFPDIPVMFQNAVDQVRPMAQDAVTHFDAFARRVVERLDRIADAVEGDDTVFTRERPDIVLATDQSGVVAVVPGGESWVLEAVTIVPSGAVGTPGSVTLGLSDLLPLWGGAHTGRPTTMGGNDVRFESGHTVRVTARETGALVTLQIRSERVAPRLRAVPAGREVRTDTPQTPPNPELGRHVGTWQTAGRG